MSRLYSQRRGVCVNLHNCKLHKSRLLLGRSRVAQRQTCMELDKTSERSWKTCKQVDKTSERSWKTCMQLDKTRELA
jgi:hypothetical protein